MQRFKQLDRVEHAIEAGKVDRVELHNLTLYISAFYETKDGKMNPNDIMGPYCLNDESNLEAYPLIRGLLDKAKGQPSRIFPGNQC